VADVDGVALTIPGYEAVYNAPPRRQNELLIVSIFPNEIARWNLWDGE
jgi:hypothetical protein